MSICDSGTDGRRTSYIRIPSRVVIRACERKIGEANTKYVQEVAAAENEEFERLRRRWRRWQWLGRFGPDEPSLDQAKAIVHKEPTSFSELIYSPKHNADYIRSVRAGRAAHLRKVARSLPAEHSMWLSVEDAAEIDLRREDTEGSPCDD